MYNIIMQKKTCFHFILLLPNYHVSIQVILSNSEVLHGYQCLVVITQRKSNNTNNWFASLFSYTPLKSQLFKHTPGFHQTGSAKEKQENTPVLKAFGEGVGKMDNKKQVELDISSS